MWQHTGEIAGLAVALGIGLLIGAERGWEERSAPDGARVAGIRTFALLALLGAVSGLLAEKYGALLLGVVVVAAAIPLAVSQYVEATAYGDRSVTTVVAALLTFGLGALAAMGLQLPAVACAVVVALLLSLKPQIHNFLKQIAAAELTAALQLLVLFAVVLPLLPDTSYGPWDAINPRQVGWMVALIAAISFIGYVAVRLVGAQRGLLATGLLGGLVSSTAVVLQFSRLLREGRHTAGALAAGMLGACAIMWLRMITVSTLVSPVLALRVALPLLLMGGIAAAWALYRKDDGKGSTPELALANPLSLGSALAFGVLLVGILLLAAAARHFFGDAGTYLASALAGIADVDAITLSLAQQANTGLDAGTAARALVLASVVNTLVKAGMAITIGGSDGARRVGLPLLTAAAAGIACVAAAGW